MIQSEERYISLDKRPKALKEKIFTKLFAEAEEKRASTLRLLGMGLSLEQVATGTQLTVEGVKELIK